MPVHVVTTSYEPGRFGRIRVTVKVSEALPMDARTMSADEMVGLLRDTMLQMSGQTYVDRYARDVKAEFRAAAEDQDQPRDLAAS